MTMNLSGQTVFVTGAAGAIGKAFVEKALARGASKVYAADVKPAAAARNVVPLVLDITDDEAVSNAARQAGDVTVLVNNAGVNLRSAFIGSQDLQNARTEMDVNYFGTLRMCRAFAPVIRANDGGAIVCMLSILAKVTLPNLGSYCASKAALLRMCEGMRAELAPSGISVTAVMPWAVDTPMSAPFQGEKTSVAAVVEGVYDAVCQGAENVYFHSFSDMINARLREDPEDLARELGGRFVRSA